MIRNLTHMNTMQAFSRLHAIALLALAGGVAMAQEPSPMSEPPASAPADSPDAPEQANPKPAPTSDAEGDAMSPASSDDMSPAPSASGDPASDAMLRGPEVPDADARTLIAYDAQGRLVQLNGRPEIAALGLLDLDPMQRDGARAAVAERNAALAAFMLDSIDLARESADALEAGKRERATEIGRELYDRFDPEHARDPLRPPLQASLSSEQAGELQRLIDEYWTVRLDRETRNARDKGGKDESDKARAAAQQRILLGLFQQELRAAYDRTLRPYRQKIEAINQIAQPTAEQRQAIRDIIINFVRETRLQPTPDQQQEVARKIYQALDEEQRMKLFEAAFTRL